MASSKPGPASKTNKSNLVVIRLNKNSEYTSELTNTTSDKNSNSDLSAFEVSENSNSQPEPLQMKDAVVKLEVMDSLMIENTGQDDGETVYDIEMLEEDEDAGPSTTNKQLDPVVEPVIESSSGIELTQINNLDDLYLNFVEYQINVISRNFQWSVSKNSRGNSVFIHRAISPATVGFMMVQINTDLKVSVKVHGRYLKEDHGIMSGKNYPKNLQNLRNLLEFLSYLLSLKLCLGNEEPEFTRLKSQGVKSAWVNRYTGSAHSDNCEGFHKLRGARCRHCVTFRSNFLRKTKRDGKTKTVGRTKNFRYMTKNDQETVMKMHLKEKKELNKQVRRLKKKEAKIQSRLKRADAEMLESYKGTNLSKANFLKLLIKYHVKCDKIKLLKSLSANRWHPAIIKWCLNFYGLSAAAYENLRNVIMLPASRTLANYSSEFPTNHGFSPEVIYELRQKIDIDEMEEHQKYFALIIDEMQTTKTEAESDAESDEAANDEDYGEALKRPPDTRIMVLMVQGLLTNFKHVLAFFPSNNMRPEERQTIVQNGIKVLENNGFKILTVICDDTPINLKFIKLSAKIDPEKGVYYRANNPFVPRNDHRDIFYICDPPQLIKSVRDCLFNSGANKYLHLFQKNGKYIIWAHVREMYKKDNLARIRMCPKLTTNHIKLGPAYVRRVTMAAQVLSNSVANAIEKLMGEDASETAKFVRYFNRFFDMLNTRKYAAGKTNRNCDLDPYTSLTDWRFQWLESEFVSYLNEWKAEIREADVSNEERKRMIMSRDTIDPVIATVHSIVGIVKFLLSRGASFVCTDKFNTDLLEHRYGKYWRADVNR